MKLYELLGNHMLLESETVTLPKVISLKDLKDPKTGKYYTGVVNVTGDVDLWNTKLSKLPVRFGKIGGYFSCGDSELTSLEGAPSSVGGSFYCNDNKLTSLEGAPSSIGDYFACSSNQLTSLEGAPSSVGGSFYCSNNKLTSLEGIHKILKKINGGFYCQRNLIKTGGIGLILIEGLTKIDVEQPAFKIIEKYVGQGKKGLLRCQDELIEAGYEEATKL